MHDIKDAGVWRHSRMKAAPSLSDKLRIFLFIPAFAFVHDLVCFMKDLVIGQVMVRPVDIHDAVTETALIFGVSTGLETS